MPFIARFLLLLLVAAWPASAQTPGQTYIVTGIPPSLVSSSNPFVIAAQPYVYTPLGFCSLSLTTGSATALGSCSGGIPTGAKFAFATPETAAIRYRDDGTAPTSAVGYPISVGAQLQYFAGLSAIQFIAQTGTPTLDVLFYK